MHHFGLVWGFFVFFLCFFISTVWLRVMSPITVKVPSLSRSRVMRFPNYCYLNERLGRRGFLSLIQSPWGGLSLQMLLPPGLAKELGMPPNGIFQSANVSCQICIWLQTLP